MPKCTAKKNGTIYIVVVDCFERHDYNTLSMESLVNMLNQLNEYFSIISFTKTGIIINNPQYKLYPILEAPFGSVIVLNINDKDNNYSPEVYSKKEFDNIYNHEEYFTFEEENEIT
jgi:hypothetical protein